MELTMRPFAALGRLRGAETGERAALRTFRDAAGKAAGYRAHLDAHGVDARAVRRLADVPYTDKRSVFGGDIGGWIIGGRVTDAAELLTSSGQSGLFSVGITSHAERRDQERTIDATLRSLGAGQDGGTLLMNCLPMGISVPTRLATVATPSVHVEVAVEMLVRAGSGFERVIIAAEPLFLKELAETALRRHGPGFGERVVACFVGGEWVAESYRRYVSALFGFPADARDRPGVLISMGAAEAGLHLLTETPALRATRAGCTTPADRRTLFGSDRGYTPSLFTWDPTRAHLEERLHEDGVRTLVMTALGRRLMPLVRYDLDDEVDIIPAREFNSRLDRLGVDVRVDRPVVAVWGRHRAPLAGDGWALHPEAVKELLFSIAAHAGALTGRFRLIAGAAGPELHLQLRQGASPGPGLGITVADAAGAAAGTPVAVIVHGHREYPYHEAGDFQHKPVYV